MTPAARIERLAVDPVVENLATVARAEGFAFLDRLVAEWTDGTNRFDRSDEVLFGAFIDGELVGTAGLTHQREELGRVRRVYVHPVHRSKGIATALMTEVLAFAQTHYSTLVLFSETPEAFRLYERLGFAPENPTGRDRATHRLIFS